MRLYKNTTLHLRLCSIINRASRSLSTAFYIFILVSLFVGNISNGLIVAAPNHNISNGQPNTTAQELLNTKSELTAPSYNSATSDIAGYPISLEIGSLSIKSNITEAKFNKTKNTWDVSDSHLNYIKASPVIKLPVSSFSGNIIVYGHNTKKLLGSLKNSDSGTIVELYTSDGYRLSYIYYNRTVTKPSDTSILYRKSKEPNLSIITCTGRFNQNRLIADFRLIGVHKE